MKPAGKGGMVEFDDLPAFGMVLDADDALETGGEHGGGHASADKLPDADFFNGARDATRRGELSAQP